jgi:hypothetical protein
VTVEPAFLDRTSAADFLGISASLIDQFKNDGTLTPIFTGYRKRKPLYRLTDLRAYAESLEDLT